MNAPETIIRQTAQRHIILEELAKAESHPTASDIYTMVRKRLPRIGLGTVYRNLELMTNNGMILKLEVGGTQKRFDAITQPHYHVRCTCCGKVENIDVAVSDDLVETAAKSCSYQILGHSIEFRGVCQDCQQTLSDTAVQ